MNGAQRNSLIMALIATFGFIAYYSYKKGSFELTDLVGASAFGALVFLFTSIRIRK